MCLTQDILAYQRRSTHRLAPGLYLGYLKLSSSVDQIKVLVSQRAPNMLCHTRIRDNANVSRYNMTLLPTRLLFLFSCHFKPKVDHLNMLKNSSDIVPT